MWVYCTVPQMRVIDLCFKQKLASTELCGHILEILILYSTYYLCKRGDGGSDLNMRVAISDCGRNVKAVIPVRNRGEYGTR